MIIWLLTIGEPVPISNENRERLHRTGQVAEFLSSNGHKVVWWTSTFDHWMKTHHFNENKSIKKNDNYELRLLYGGGYKNNFSVLRFIDHFRIAKKFKIVSQKEVKPDIIVSAFPDIELSYEAIKFGKKYGVPVVVDLRDMWPDIFIAQFPKFLRSFGVYFLFFFFYKTKRIMKDAYSLIGITDAFIEWGLNKVNRKNTENNISFPFTYLSLPPTTTNLIAAEQYWDSIGINTKTDMFIVICIITVSRFGDFNTIIESAKHFSRNNEKVKFIICGDGDKLEYFRSVTKNINNIKFIGWVDAAKIYVLMRRASIGLDPLIEREDFLSTINNKAVEYMSAGLPIVSSPSKGILADLLYKQGCGFSYNTGDSIELNNIIEKYLTAPELLQNHKDNSQKLFYSTFCAEKVHRNFKQYLEKIVSGYEFR